MIYNLSGRTDLIAFYYPWLINRLQAGFVDVRHPFDQHRVLRYSLKPEDVDAFVICTKNPLPLLRQPEPFQPYAVLLQVTITPYGKDLEPNVPRKKEIIEALRPLAGLFGRENLAVRYDPIIVNQKYTLAQHEKSFEHLIGLLHDVVNTFIISFVDEYQNTKKHHIQALTPAEIAYLGCAFGRIAQKYGVRVQTCGEAVDLSQVGIVRGNCIDPVDLARLTGKKLDWVKEKPKRPACHCADYRDIGAYNCCLHFCRYCYANYDEDQIWQRYRQHRPQSSLLIGELAADDEVIVVRPQARQITLFE